MVEVWGNVQDKSMRHGLKDEEVVEEPGIEIDKAEARTRHVGETTDEVEES
jgi:hypothetical protein